MQLGQGFATGQEMAHDAFWKKDVTIFSCFDCQRVELGRGFTTGLPIGAARPGLRNGLRKSLMKLFGKKL